MCGRTCAAAIRNTTGPKTRSRPSRRTGRSRGRGRLPLSNNERRIDRVASEARAVDSEAVGQRRARLEPDAELAARGRLLDGLARHGCRNQPAVRARLAQAPILRLLVPRKDPPVVGRIIRQLERPGRAALEINRDGARESVLVRHWIGIRVLARIVGAGAPHEVALDPLTILDILPIKLLGGCL